ncbi:hypothetical protein GCM10027568_01040 [Humibacter soli]
MSHGDVSIGVAGTLGPDAIALLAPAVEQAGFRSLWVNDTPGGDSIAALEAAADVTSSLLLATGVIPVDRRHAHAIVSAVRRAELPEHRLVLGIGAGQTRNGALAMVGDAVEVLHDRLSARVLVGALGPKMRRLGARRADGVLLSWLTPAVAIEQAGEARGAASASHVALYVRTALEASAGSRLAEEAARYGGYPAYAANFERLGIGAQQTVMDAERFDERIRQYRDAVDEVVLRVIAPGDTVDDHLRFIEAAAERLRAG